jgi:hypothetical protein
MPDVARRSQAAGSEVPPSAAQLLPLVYSELRQLAAQKLSHEKPGQTLQATALVHEAWLRLVREEDRTWNDPQHFFCAAADARSAGFQTGLARPNSPNPPAAPAASPRFISHRPSRSFGLSRQHATAPERRFPNRLTAPEPTHPARSANRLAQVHFAPSLSFVRPKPATCRRSGANNFWRMRSVP